MKIIDLLNKIANEDKIPNKIIYDEREYTYHDKEHGYCRYAYDNTYVCIDTEYYLFDILNDEVEIIEEDKKMEKLEFLRNIENGIEILTVPSDKMIIDKINEIIDKINEDK